MVKKSKFNVAEVSSLDEYLGNVNKNHASDKRLPSLFRGQSEDLPLLPKLARIYNEGRLRGKNFSVAEDEMLKEFERQAAIYTSFSMTHWEIMSLAQHHGMATRLLDWTENPLLAMWFAVNKPAKNEKEAVVWVFNPKEQDYIDVKNTASVSDIKRTRVLIPRHSNPRVRVQAGLFTIHFFIEGKNRFVPLESNSGYISKLSKFIIRPKNFASIRSDLDRCGINSGTMFPDLSGLAAHIEWKNSDLEDEML